MYSLQFINKVLRQRAQLSIQKLSEKYDISTRTIQNWIQGKLPLGKRNRSNTKLDINKLLSDIKDYPDAYQYERAERLGVSAICILKNLRKLQITYKKNTKAPQSRRREAIIVSKQDSQI